MIPTIFGVILLIFFLFNWVGGDPAQVLAGQDLQPRADRQHPQAARRGRALHRASSGSS
jgi:ABC-type dipeptide/oligopeptide/nickel transport system permease component